MSLRQRLYPEFARIGAALASDKRLEVIDLLAQAPRNVDALADLMGMSVASVSQHLQVLRNARLVEARRSGNKVFYSLADELVVHLWLTLRAVGEKRLAEVDQIRREYEQADGEPPLTLDELQEMLAAGSVELIDVRPRTEYEFGHLAGARSLPVDELEQHISELPPDKLLVTYCRGVYCVLSNDAETLLRARGFRVRRLDGGWPEWWDQRRPIAAG
jgi:DNA-binding transcriptional ArsR family regulator